MDRRLHKKYIKTKKILSLVLSFLLVITLFSSNSPTVYAASPSVASESSATDADGGAFSITLSGTPASGDLYIVFLQSGDAAASWTQTTGTTGWTEMYDSNGGAVYYKQLTGSETPSFTSSSASRSGSSHLKITGHENPATQAPEVSAGATGTSSSPDPDTVTPTGGSKDYLFIAVSGNTDGRETVTAGPSGYSTVVAFNTGGGPNGGSGGHAYLQSTASSADPGTFTLSGSSDWEARTIAVHPSTATPTYTQNDFEWFVTTDSVTLTNVWPSGGGANLAENEVLTQLPATNEPLKSGDQIRIQMNFTLGGATLSASTQAFKLQYDAADDCTTATGWTDVGAKASGSIWRLFDESSIGDSTAQVNDISTSTSSAEGYYSEINASGTNPNEVLVTENSEWDWPVENNGAAENTTYCFRMVLSDGTPFDTYNSDSYPKLTTAPGTSDLMRHGNFFQGQAEQGLFWAN